MPESTEYAGQDSAQPPAAKPGYTVDLQRVRIAPGTFSNPFFWMFVGAATVVVGYYFFKKMDH